MKVQANSSKKCLLHPGKADPYADIDFEEINEQTNLANDEIKCLKVQHLIDNYENILVHLSIFILVSNILWFLDIYFGKLSQFR